MKIQDNIFQQINETTQQQFVQILVVMYLCAGNVSQQLGSDLSLDLWENFVAGMGVGGYQAEP